MSSRVAAVAARCLRAPAAPVRVLHLGSIEVLPPPVAALGARTKVMAAPQNPRLFSSAAATASKDFYSKGAAPERDALLTAPLTAQPMLLGNRRLVSTQRVADDAGDATKAALATKEAEETAKDNTSKGKSESTYRSKDGKNFSFTNMRHKFVQCLRRIEAEFISASGVGAALLAATFNFLKDLDEGMMDEVDERLTKYLSRGTDLTQSTESTDPQFAPKKAEIDAKGADQKKDSEDSSHSAIIAHLQCLKDTLSNNHYLEQEIHELMLIIHEYYENVTERGVECNIEMEEKLQAMLQARAANIGTLDDQLSALKESRLS